MIYLLQMDCGDYYCDGQHPAGAYSSRDKAEAALEGAKDLPDPTHGLAMFTGGHIIEIDVDAPPKDRE